MHFLFYLRLLLLVWLPMRECHVQCHRRLLAIIFQCTSESKGYSVKPLHMLNYTLSLTSSLYTHTHTNSQTSIQSYQMKNVWFLLRVRGTWDERTRNTHTHTQPHRGKKWKHWKNAIDMEPIGTPVLIKWKGNNERAHTHTHTHDKSKLILLHKIYQYWSQTVRKRRVDVGNDEDRTLCLTVGGHGKKSNNNNSKIELYTI